MRRFSTLTLILSVSSTLVACSGQSASNVEPGILTSSDVSFAPAADKAGGQPGPIGLRGSLVTNAGVPTGQVRLRATAGHDGAGHVAINKSIPTLSPDLTPNDRKEIALAQASNLYVQFGCDETFADDIGVLRQSKMVPAKKALVRAKVAIFCGPIAPEYAELHVSAEKIILAGARLKLDGGADVRLTLIANEFSIRGDNSLLTKGRDNAAREGAPRVTLVGNHVSGRGQLYVDAEGSDVVVDKAPAPRTELEIPGIPF